MFSTPDLCDQYPDKVKILNFDFRDYGQINKIQGQIATVECINDNSKVREALETEGNNRILLVDGKSSDHCALVGDNLAKLAIKNKWAGIIVIGRIRDCEIIKTMPIMLKALGTHPKKSEKWNSGEKDKILMIQQHIIKPGDYIYADENGVLSSESALT